MKDINRMYLQYHTAFSRETYIFHNFEDDPNFSGNTNYYQSFILRLIYEKD